jgi:hypothetical protein
VTLDFLQAAETDYAESIAYYEQQRDGLGMEFAAEVKRALNRILQYPDAWTALSANTRRCRLSRFPCAVIFQIRQDMLLIVAIQNLHRNPVSWETRINPS